MAVVTISREYASGGRKVGKLLAKRRNYDEVELEGKARSELKRKKSNHQA